MDGGPTSTADPAYSYYSSLMGRYHLGSMMGGGSYGRMMGRSGYGWTMGGVAAPGWMTGGSLPGFMMGSDSDPDQVMGRLFADAPGPRVTPVQAAVLDNQAPAGASVDRAANRVVFMGQTACFAVVASPAGNPDETYRVARLVDPTIVVPRDARISIEFVNADADTAHGLVVTPGAAAASSSMPLMAAAPAFAGSALGSWARPPRPGCTRRASASPPARRATTCTSIPVPATPRKGWPARLS